MQKIINWSVSMLYNKKNWIIVGNIHYNRRNYIFLKD